MEPWTDDRPMQPLLNKDRLVYGALILGGMIIFALDMTPIRGADDGAAYGLIIALAAYFGRRQVVFSAIFGAALAIIGPLLGAEAGESLLEILSGRLLGLVVLALLTVVLLHLIDSRAKVTASDTEIDAHQQGLRKITRLALADDKSLSERLQIITEWTVTVLGVDRACVGRVEQFGQRFRLYDAWDKRSVLHSVDPEPPACYQAEYRALMEDDLVSQTPDVRQSAMRQGDLDFYQAREIVALLHVAAAYRGEVVASLILSYGQVHVWSEREIAFAKSVAQIVALIFALDDCQQNLQRLDRVSQGIFVIGGDGRVVYANHAARQLANSDDAAPCVPFALPPLPGAGDHHQIQFDGREFELYRSRLPADEILLRIDDVTARNDAMARAAQMEVQLKESAKLQAMGQMAAGISHDFNNILGAIMGYAQGLQHKLEAMPLERNFADRILGACKKGQAMTREILGVARTASMVRDEIDLSDLISSDIDEMQGISEGHATLTLQPLAERLPVYGNAAQLSQLVQNLVVNATHACEGGDGRITVSAGRASREELHMLATAANTARERVLGVIAENRDYCYLRVADNGHGIPPDVMDHIFEPFFTTKGRAKGSGLGLVVVHGVVDSHQGSCHVVTRPGEGTVFTIYLPMYEEAETVAA